MIRLSWSPQDHTRPIFRDGRSRVSDALGIQRLRRRWSLSTRGMGRQLGVSSRTIENWEQGRNVPTWALVALSRLPGAAGDL